MKSLQFGILFAVSALFSAVSGFDEGRTSEYSPKTRLGGGSYGGTGGYWNKGTFNWHPKHQSAPQCGYSTWLWSQGPPDLVCVARTVPQQDEFLIFDIKADRKLKAEEVLASLQHFNVLYKMRTLDSRRFIIVVQKDAADNRVYSDLHFPDGASVTVNFAERLGDYYASFGEKGTRDREVITFPDENLLYTEYTVNADPGQGLDSVKKTVMDLGRVFAGFNNQFQNRLLHLTSTSPTKLIQFLSAPAYVYDRVLLESSAVLSGPGAISTTTTPIVKV